MSIDEYMEKDVSDVDSILQFVKSLKNQRSELVLSSNGENVGAILTAEQYEWFLDQLDAQQDIKSISARVDDKEGSQSLSDFKKEFDK